MTTIKFDINVYVKKTEALANMFETIDKQIDEEHNKPEDPYQGEREPVKLKDVPKDATKEIKEKIKEENKKLVDEDQAEREKWKDEKKIEHLGKAKIRLRANVPALFNRDTHLFIRENVSPPGTPPVKSFDFHWRGSRNKFNKHKETFKEVFASLIFSIYEQYVEIYDLHVTGNRRRIKIMIYDRSKQEVDPYSAEPEKEEKVPDQSSEEIKKREKNRAKRDRKKKRR